MPPALVQVASGVDAPVAFLSANTVHNTNVVMVRVETADIAIFSVTDTAGNIYTSLPIQHISAPFNVWSQLFYCLDIAGGANSVTGSAINSLSVPLTGVTCAVHEISGVTTKDANAAATGTGLSQNSGSISLAQNVEFLFGYEAANQLTGQASVTEGSGWTLAQSNVIWLTQYRVTSSSGLYSSTTTSTVGKGGACSWIEEILALYTLATASIPSNVIVF